jgi:AcrR family transcriptional regulator
MPRRPSYDRDDLIARARDLFWAQGWAGTSMKDLENVLGLKPGSFYAAFGSKDALYGLARDLYAQEGSAALAELVQDLGAFAALQELPARTSSTECQTKACMISKTLLELPLGEHDLGQRADALLARKEAEFAALFTQA